MELVEIIRLAQERGASDVHVAAGQPVVLRVRGELCLLAAQPVVSAAEAEAMTRAVLSAEEWAHWRVHGSADKALTVDGVRCRVNALRSAGAAGLAVRLLPGAEVTLENLNLHPDLAALVEPEHGLVLVSGPTGCGKSSTLAALVQEVNRTRAAHIVTLEQPVEFELRPERSFLRQREVGRDTPSFAQGLHDATREDIDVLMVGEMRERETMRLTLDACETGHLVLATLHSASVIEALQRIVAAFPAQEQPSVCAQLADVLVAAVSQRLVWREDPGLRVPECEILRSTTAVRAVVRQGQFFKLPMLMDTGARTGQWTLPRYREWLEARTTWVRPAAPHAPAAGTAPAGARAASPAPAPPRPGAPEPPRGKISDILSELD